MPTQTKFRLPFVFDGNNIRDSRENSGGSIHCLCLSIGIDSSGDLELLSAPTKLAA